MEGSIVGKRLTSDKGKILVLFTSLGALLVILFFSAFVFYATRKCVVRVGLYCLLATSAFGFAFGSQQAVVGSLELDLVPM